MLRLRWLVPILFTAACTGTISSAENLEDAPVDETQNPSEDDETGDTPSVPRRTQTFAESEADVLNPERGFYRGVDLLQPSSMSQVRARGSSIAIALVRLDDFRGSDLSSTFLSDLQAGFDAARDAGIKLVLRFTYNASFSEDATLDAVLAHIAQLSAILQDNEDVISVLQAGFIGAWGEWHASTNGLDTPTARDTILQALLDAVPSSRSVQVRTPMYKRDSVFSEDSRIGHHNDCFLASDSDFGTYGAPLDEWRDYLADDTQHAPMGGETCHLNAPRSDCENALAELETFHWSYLNREFKQEVLGAWEAQGCMPVIERRLGYRFVLEELDHPESLQAGQTAHFSAKLRNHGFAAPYNARTAYLVLRGAEATHIAPLAGVDLRKWQPGDSMSVEMSLDVPAGLPTGDYELALWIPDASPSIASDARFAIRFANEGTWDEARGENRLLTSIPLNAASETP